MSKISIIVPVYNTEKYLSKCLNSLIKQTYKDIEIIVVNDGSKDKSLEIAKKIAKQDNRIKVFNKENGGLSSARNFGIEKASGEYIGFVDSDDYIKENMFEILYNMIKEANAKIAICGWYLVEDNQIISINFEDADYEELQDRKKLYVIKIILHQERKYAVN